MEAGGGGIFFLDIKIKYIKGIFIRIIFPAVFWKIENEKEAVTNKLKSVPTPNRITWDWTKDLIVIFRPIN